MAGSTGRRASGVGVRHDRGGCVGHVPPWCDTSSGLGCYGRSCSSATRDAEKRSANSRLAPNGLPLVPFSVEPYGRLGKPAVVFLGMLGA
jgi:hypothetical protein